MASAKHHIAIVTADENEFSKLAGILGISTCIFTRYGSPLALVEAIHSGKVPDLIIADLHHAEMNGWRLCMLLRSQAFMETQRVPIIVTTPITRDTEFLSMARGLGVDAVVTLPYEPATLKRTVRELLPGKGNSEGLNILAIDDDPELLQYLETGLKVAGLKTHTSDNGARGLELFTAVQPDATILDHSLGDCQAKDIIPAIIKARQKSDSVIILITGVPEPGLAIEYVRLGVDAFVRKPFTIPYLIDVIHKSRREHFMLRVVELLETSIKSLSEAERQSRDLYENAPLGYHVLDPSGLIVLMNRTELRWLGYTAEEIVGKKRIFDIQTPESAVRGRKMFTSLPDANGIVYGELEFRKKDGTIVPVAIQALPVKDSTGKLASCRTIVQDLSERTRIERQLWYAHKFESTRDLVEGVAHNFNNILTPVLVNATHLAAEFPSGSEEHAIVDDIVNSARRGADLVKQLSALTHQDDDLKAVVNLKKIVSQTSNILRNTLDASITVVTDILCSSGTTRGNAGQIQQALLNVCLNSRDAMPDGGTLTISLQEAPAPGRTDNFFCLAVADTGTGIPPEVQSRIFDPFFTTKGLAKNMGLGLSATYATVKIHSGFIDVQSTPGKGTTIRMFLPIVQPPPREDSELDGPNLGEPLRAGGNIGEASPARQADRQQTILVIDDEAALLKALSVILRQAGYDVICAQDGKSGLDLFRRSTALGGEAGTIKAPPVPAIDLVILDLLLPDISGEQVIQDIRAIAARLPIIVVTGCHARKRLMDLMDMAIGAVVTKPFDNQIIVREVQRFLK